MRMFLNVCFVFAIGFVFVWLPTSDAQAANGPSAGLPPTTELMPWTVGADLTLIVGLHANGKTTPRDDYKYQRVKKILDYLDVQMPKLPASDTERGKKSAEALHLLMGDFGKEVSQALQKHFDARHGHLLEVAIKSGSLLILYAPGDEMGFTIARVLEDRAGKAMLPTQLWMPLVNKIRARVPAQEIIKSVLEFQGKVEMHLEENGTLLPGRESLTAYELGFHWGMVADAFIYKSDLIRAEFLPRAKRNAKLLGIDLSQHRLRVVLGRKDNAEGRRWQAIHRQKSIKNEVDEKLGSSAAALFQLGSQLQLERESYNPNKSIAARYVVESIALTLRKLALPTGLSHDLFDPLDKIAKELVSKDEFNKTVFKINGEILNTLRRRMQSANNRGTKQDGNKPKTAPAVLSDADLARMAVELTSKHEKPAPPTGFSFPVPIPPLTQQSIENALKVHMAFNGTMPQTTDEFMKEIVQKNIIHLPRLPLGKRFNWDPFLKQLTIVDDLAGDRTRPLRYP